MTTEPKGERVRRAAAVVLVRDGRARGQELYWVRRSAEVSLGGGFHAFPGGRVDSGDRELAAAARPDGDVDEATARVTALRELFEETGVLPGLDAGTAPPVEVARLRRALLEDACTFADALRALAARLDLDALTPAGRWITPPFVRTRFDALFYVARLPRGQTAEVWPGELVSGEWITPDAALALWERGRALLHPPALHVLRCLAAAPWPACADALRHEPGVRDHVPQTMEFQAGVRLVPLRTPTLPPATHTHCYVVGDEELIVVDPGAHDPAEQQFLFDACDAFTAGGRRVREIVLTHEHVDHVGAAAALRARLGVPLRAHALTAERVRGQIPVDGLLHDGEHIELPGRLRQAWRAIHTPGHARGHLCFFEEDTRALLAGDMLAGEGTVVIPEAPEGDMADYLASLAALDRLEPRTIYPAHGPIIVDGRGRIQAYIAHRAERERAVVAALGAAGRALPEELVPGVYNDVAPALHALAAHSLRAVLEKLAKEGRAERGSDGRYALAA
jgi:glyoxylase-like metal-dependent hydrolase (beta-lactamase superfamily II)/8-oxo-dGTP pyrophosphatase MutT (NUDIX family)